LGIYDLQLEKKCNENEKLFLEVVAKKEENKKESTCMLLLS